MLFCVEILRTPQRLSRGPDADVIKNRTTSAKAIHSPPSRVSSDRRRLLFLFFLQNDSLQKKILQG